MESTVRSDARGPRQAVVRKVIQGLVCPGLPRIGTRQVFERDSYVPACDGLIAGCRQLPQGLCLAAILRPGSDHCGSWRQPAMRPPQACTKHKIVPRHLSEASILLPSAVPVRADDRAGQSVHPAWLNAPAHAHCRPFAQNARHGNHRMIQQSLPGCSSRTAHTRRWVHRSVHH